MSNLRDGPRLIHMQEACPSVPNLLSGADSELSTRHNKPKERQTDREYICIHVFLYSAIVIFHSTCFYSYHLSIGWRSMSYQRVNPDFYGQTPTDPYGQPQTQPSGMEAPFPRQPGYPPPPPRPGFPPVAPPSGYQGYFREGPPPPQGQMQDDNSLIKACLAALCCCCLLERCCP